HPDLHAFPTRRSSDLFPPGVYQPMVKTRSIDDVPMLALTLWSDEYDDFQIRQIAEEVSSEVKKIKDVSTIREIGGRNRELKVVRSEEHTSELQSRENL